MAGNRKNNPGREKKVKPEEERALQQERGVGGALGKVCVCSGDPVEGWREKVEAERPGEAEGGVSTAGIWVLDLQGSYDGVLCCPLFPFEVMEVILVLFEEILDTEGT